MGSRCFKVQEKGEGSRTKHGARGDGDGLDERGGSHRKRRKAGPSGSFSIRVRTYSGRSIGVPRSIGTHRPCPLQRRAHAMMGQRKESAFWRHLRSWTIEYIRTMRVR